MGNIKKGLYYAKIYKSKGISRVSECELNLLSLVCLQLSRSDKFEAISGLFFHPGHSMNTKNSDQDCDGSGFC